LEEVQAGFFNNNLLLKEVKNSTKPTKKDFGIGGRNKE
jgi:hypothetical protein